ncbi:MAG: winged helix DNA-binding domain-containing protein [Actinomycetota bacterium]|nr:winged helix DNA-binding domain-containing protein [Actinomycetota bacterium]
MTVRELNRALLGRQMLLARRRVSVPAALERLVALQAQYAPSPYIALWSRIECFRKEQLDRALSRGDAIKGGMMRNTLHVAHRAVYPQIASAHAETMSGRAAAHGGAPDGVWAALPDTPLDREKLFALAGQVLETADRQVIASVLRMLPLVHTDPIGPWPHTKPSPAVRWREPLPAPRKAIGEVVRRYLAAYGPATRQDIQQFTGYKQREIEIALTGAREMSDGLYDVPRALRPPPDAPAPVRFLPPYDSIILAHRDRSRILPDEYYETVIRRKNATTLGTFTADGFIAGSWKIDGARLHVAPFAPLPAKWRRQVEDEGARLKAFWNR